MLSIISYILSIVADFLILVLMILGFKYLVDLITKGGKSGNPLDNPKLKEIFQKVKEKTGIDIEEKIQDYKKILEKESQKIEDIKKELQNKMDEMRSNEPTQEQVQTQESNQDPNQNQIDDDSENKEDNKQSSQERIKRIRSKWRN